MTAPSLHDLIQALRHGVDCARSASTEAARRLDDAQYMSNVARKRLDAIRAQMNAIDARRDRHRSSDSR
jgi:hypothetical protein